MSKYETLDYEILFREEIYEIRYYFDFYVVEYECLKDPNMEYGFSTLFDYISNDNQENIKIPMTVPVLQNEFSKYKTMAFIIPAKFGQNIPKPNNPNLSIKKFESGLFATIRYSGIYDGPKKSKQAKMKKKLDQWIISQNYTIESDSIFVTYNSPFVLPLFRKNELWVRISKKQMQAYSDSIVI